MATQNGIALRNAKAGGQRCPRIRSIGFSFRNTNAAGFDARCQGLTDMLDDG